MPIGDHLRDVMDLYGSPKCPHTNAVLIAAGEKGCLLYTSPSPRDLSTSRMPSSA